MPVEYAAPDALLDLASDPTGMIVVAGERNVLRIGPDTIFDGRIQIEGHDCEVIIGSRCEIHGVIHVYPGASGRLEIGSGTTVTDASFTFHESGEIVVGEDCMISSDVHLDVSDVHPLFDAKSGLRINPPRPIRIGSRVWVGARTMVLKGSTIGDGAVIGAGSVVRGRIPDRVVAHGSPARVVRRGVEWRRSIADRIAPQVPVSRSWLPWRKAEPLSEHLPAQPGTIRMNVDWLGNLVAPFQHAPVAVSAGRDIVLIGFAFEMVGKLVRAVEIAFDDRIYPGHYGEARDDIRQTYGEDVACCGFRAIVPGDAVRPGQHLLSLRAILADGSGYDTSPILELHAT